ncbi:ferritin-like domain-containing protein [Micromonospora sp. M61]|uniref:ferritin-like domain-containing protein n=1 Tax=Micromonospora sp. M61 TaxID=2824890 RepID=UPI001B377D03|nr:ferritin-like domain-containing protein [Micromonospora sp. M61]MBQ0979820.1 ferritin-like domain-containing protein [Micromonospora sp. M61]
MGFETWVREFTENAERRREEPDPPWDEGSPLSRALIRSLQRFQAGEDGDGANLIRKSASAGDPSYLAAVRLFVAEEQNHARLLKQLLLSTGGDVIDGHWTDRVFVAIRRALGLRLELMTLMVAEVVALRYYRSVRDGTADPLLTDVGARILTDEQRHVPFHTERLREAWDGRSRPVRAALAAGWWALLLGAVVVVAYGHGAALRLLGVGRLRFIADTATLFRPVVREVLFVPRREVRLTTPTTEAEQPEMASTVRRTRTRLWRWGTILLVIAGLAVALYPPAHFWGPRPYRHPDGLFGVTRGDFEDDILPHYEVSLPCDVDGLRYSNAEDMTGPMGQLYLHFTTSQGCLDRILDGWAAVPAEPSTMAPTDPGFPLPAAAIPGTIGWRFDAPSYQVYRREGDVVTGDVVVVRDGRQLRVYLLARYAY